MQSTSVDLAPLINPILGALGLALAGLITGVAGWAVNELRKRNVIALTDQQRSQVLGAINTSAGIMIADLARGAAPLERVNISSPQIRDLAQRAVTAIPAAADALGLSQEKAAQMIVGVVGNAISGDPTIPTVPVTTATTSETTGAAGTIKTDTASTDVVVPPVQTSGAAKLVEPKTS